MMPAMPPGPGPTPGGMPAMPPGMIRPPFGMPGMPPWGLPGMAPTSYSGQPSGPMGHLQGGPLFPSASSSLSVDRKPTFPAYGDPHEMKVGLIVTTSATSRIIHPAEDISLEERRAQLSAYASKTSSGVSQHLAQNITQPRMMMQQPPNGMPSISPSPMPAFSSHSSMGMMPPGGQMMAGPPMMRQSAPPHMLPPPANPAFMQQHQLAMMGVRPPFGAMPGQPPGGMMGQPFPPGPMQPAPFGMMGSAPRFR